MTSGRAIFAVGEEELLAYYLKDINPDGEHDFCVPDDINAFCVLEGIWEDFSQHPQRKAQLDADSISYGWDLLIEGFNTHILAGTQHYVSHPGVEYAERIMRFFAREPRVRRRMLTKILVEMIQTTSISQRCMRVVQPSKPGDPYYAFLLLPHPQNVSEEEYRQVRRHVLERCCMITKLMYPTALDIVGYATEANPQIDSDRSDDAIYLDARVWTEEQQAEARDYQQHTGILTNLTHFSGVVQEYPDVVRQSTKLSEKIFSTSKFQNPEHSAAFLIKGRDRNKPCFCGSGKKLKKCCGQ